jgi:soluble lytic murein transglycosylase-like protein
MDYEAIFQRVAAEFDLGWYLLMEQAYRESQLNAHLVGSDGEMGLMQILPATWGEWAPRVGALEPFDPESNIRVATAYLAWIHARLAGMGRPEMHWMLAAYDYGFWNVQGLLRADGAWRHVPPEHQDYATAIVLAAEADALAAQMRISARVIPG